MFLSTTDYPTGKIIEFNIEASKDGKNAEIKAIHDELSFKEELSFGKIHIRKDNNDLWYINPAGTIARFITRDQLELFKKWDKQTLLPTDKQLEILEEIGGLPSSPYSLFPDNLQIPATITTKSGERVDLCLFHFSQSPPFQRHFKKVLFISDIAEIRPSELALTHDLRLASALAEEIRMSFYPFMVKTNTGKLITHNGITQFASTGVIKGNEIISEVKFSYDNFDKLNDVSNDDITFIIGKWDDRIKELFVQYRQQLERKTAIKSNFPKAKRSWWQKLFSS